MKCKFETISEGIHKCSQCGFTLKTNQLPEKVYRNCRPERDKPSIIEQGKELLKTYATHIITGSEYVTEEEKQQRLKICGRCEHFEENHCKLCTCAMNVKAELKTAKCPIGKW